MLCTNFREAITKNHNLNYYLIRKMWLSSEFNMEISILNIILRSICLSFELIINFFFFKINLFLWSLHNKRQYDHQVFTPSTQTFPVVIFKHIFKILSKRWLFLINDMSVSNLTLYFARYQFILSYSVKNHNLNY